jgi:DNA-binding CsgD family transcriptional regulator
VTELTGRRAECDVLDQFLTAVRGGASRALVIYGEAGMGKTALLEYMADHAEGCRVVRAAGVQTEMELAFATLHQLCAPLLDYLERLPRPQRDALLTVFGLSAGPPPDRFLTGLAVLSLLSEAAGKEPLLCLIDDVQWADHASAQVLTFAARRLGTESVGLVLATRALSDDLAGLRRLAVAGLREADARALLEAALTGPVDAQVRDQIVAETHGNPLALLELPRTLTAAELAGGFGLPGALRLPGSVEESFQRRVGALPAETRRLLALAAADPVGDAALVWRAAGRLGIGPGSAGPAVEAGLAEFGARVRYRHPLVRSVAYRSAPARERHQAHAALAAATDPDVDPDRHAWHQAQATSAPDEDVAAELERSAGRARARGGLAAAAAFLEHAAILTPDPARRAGRALDAAQAKFQAGAFDAARDLLVMAEAGPITELQQARVDLLRAQIAFAMSRGSDAPPLLLGVAGRLERIDASLSRATYLDAMKAAMFAGRLAGPGGSLPEVARVVGAAARSLESPRAPDLLLVGLTARFNEGYAAGVPILRRALAAYASDVSEDEEVRSLWLAGTAAMHTWDDESWQAISARFVQLSRDTGSLTELPIALLLRAHLHLFSGELSAAASLLGELQAVADATGSHFTPYITWALAAWRGREAEVSALVEATITDAIQHGQGLAIAVASWAEAVLHNGLGHYGQAMTAAHRASCYDGELTPSDWALVELIEAATRSQMAETAAGALSRLAEQAEASGTDWVLGAAARCRALLSQGDAAEGLYREAITRLARTRMRPDLARAHLLYGEWLRRERRRAEAREQLRTAHGMLDAIGMDGFAERARRELRATGETARKRADAASDQQLTMQESQVAQLARDGMSNPEIGARLFLSPRTVQYHLGNVFAKLGISSRNQLRLVLPADAVTGLRRLHSERTGHCPSRANRLLRPGSPIATGDLRGRQPPRTRNQRPRTSRTSSSTDISWPGRASSPYAQAIDRPVPVPWLVPALATWRIRSRRARRENSGDDDARKL